MDPLDAFYQQLDSDKMLKQFASELVAEARETLAQNPSVRLAGFITEPDAADAPVVREILTKLSGGKAPPPNGLMVGCLPRAFAESMLIKRFGTEPWLEQGWQPQQVLPVVVSTRDGHRFGFFGIGAIGSSSM